MNGVEFIKRELECKCYGNVAVTYSDKRQHLFVEITTDLFFQIPHGYYTKLNDR